MNIMIANESRLLGEGVSMMIKASFANADIVVTDSAKDVIRTIGRPAKSDWQIILIDSQLSELISPKRLNRLIPEAKVCLFNAKKNWISYDEHHRKGFNGVLDDSSSSGDLKKAMKALLSGRDFFPEETNQFSRGFFRTKQKSNKTSVITYREQEVLSLMALGLSNKEIARHFGLAEATVKRHISNTFKKLGVKNRVEATHMANEKGLLH